MVKLLSKQLVIYSIICLFFVSVVSSKNSTDSMLKFSVNKIEKDIVPPVNNPHNYSDIAVTVACENTSKSPVQFDQIKAVFLTSNKPESASTYNWEKTTYGVEALSGYYSDGKIAYPPEIKPGLLMTIEKGWKKIFQFQTANSQYGVFRSIFIKKELQLKFYRNNKLVYGPYQIRIWLL